MVNLTTLVEEVGTALAPVAEEQARRFRWQAAGELVVRGSEPLLKRVLVNLVDNAFRHTPATAGVDVGARREGRYAVMEVRDHGPGVDPPSCRTSSSGFDTGLAAAAGSVWRWSARSSSGTEGALRSNGWTTAAREHAYRWCWRAGGRTAV